MTNKYLSFSENESNYWITFQLPIVIIVLYFFPWIIVFVLILPNEVRR